MKHFAAAHSLFIHGLSLGNNTVTFQLTSQNGPFKKGPSEEKMPQQFYISTVMANVASFTAPYGMVLSG